ncbi:MAG: DUF4294 domain-containing protein [Mangrovibacterium sp.]
MWLIRLFVLITGAVFLMPEVIFAQSKVPVPVGCIITAEGDTLPHVYIKPVVVTPRNFNSRHDVRKYWRLAGKVKKVYPFAQKAASLLREYDAFYMATSDPKKRRQYAKEVEKELFDEYGPQLKKLSLSEGRILIKLIDRETHHTSYELIKDLKGGLAAFFWQGVAKVFGNNLKDEYDPVTEDRMIEEIIFYIDMGLI